MKIVLDIEADDLLLTVTAIHCIVCKDIDTGDVYAFDGEMDGFADFMQGVDTVIGHNVIGYDLPVINKILGLDYSSKKILDTMIMSKLFDPDRRMPNNCPTMERPGKLATPHSLFTWGFRLGLNKIDFHNYTRYTPEMLEYCKGDVELTHLIYNHLLPEAINPCWEEALYIEHEVAKIITEQEIYGVRFDVGLALKNIETLDELMTEIEESVEPRLPEKQLPASQIKHPPKKRFKKNGEPSALAIKYFGDRIIKATDTFLVDGKETYVSPTHKDSDWQVKYDDETVPLNQATKPLVSTAPMSLADHSHIKQWLMDVHGWNPTMWNVVKDKDTHEKRKTSPKFADAGKNLCPDLERIGEDVDFVKEVVDWLSYRNRRNIIKSKTKDTGLLCNERLEIDGRLSASADTIGTNTRRFTHRNVANIPKVTSLFGREMRSLFTVDPGRYLIGWDASGLEDRVKAHYCYGFDGKEYAEKILDPLFDVHTENANLWGIPRDTAKGGLYCLSYGGQAPKLAEVLGVSLPEAEEYFQQYWDLNNPLRQVQLSLERAWDSNRKSFITGLDGCKLRARSKHSLVSTLFQSGGIILMKYAMVWWYKAALQQGFDAHQVIHYHDEAQVDVHKDLVEFKRFDTQKDAEMFSDPDRIWGTMQEHNGQIFRAYSKVGELGVLSIREAGKRYKLNVPLEAEYKVGKTWADTH